MTQSYSESEQPLFDEAAKLLKAYDEAMAHQKTLGSVSNASLIVMANYGDLAAGLLRGLLDLRATPPAATAGIADRLVDWTYLHATEGQQWPSTKTKSMLIARAMEGDPTQDHADGMKAVAPARCSAGIDEAQAIVTEWIGMFDPPPQIDFQQSEMLQQAIAHALRHDAQGALESACRTLVAECVNPADGGPFENGEWPALDRVRSLLSPISSTNRHGACQVCGEAADLTCGPSRFGAETWACRDCWRPDTPTVPAHSITTTGA